MCFYNGAFRCRLCSDGQQNGLGLLWNLTEPKAVEDRIARISDIFLTNSYQMKHRRKERAKSGVRARKRACEVRSVREKRACLVRSAREKKSVRSEERVRKKERAKWGVRTKYSAYEEFLGICRLLIEPLFDCRLRCSNFVLQREETQRKWSSWSNI